MPQIRRVRNVPITVARHSGLSQGVAIENQRDELPPLDYATPPRPERSPALSPLAAVFGTIAGLFGVFVLCYGVRGIVWLARDWKRADGEDVFAVFTVNFIGALSAFFAVRWIRSAMKSPGRTSDR